jgi:hypothetical protein
LQSPLGGGVATVGIDGAARTRSYAYNHDAPPALPGMSAFGVLDDAGQRLLQSVKPPSGRQEWTLQVAPAEPNREHTLTWRVPPSTPKRWHITLENPITGERVDMRQREFYRFTPAEAQTLRVVVEPSVAAPVRIINLAASVSRGGQATLQFQLTGEATLRAEIRTARGETIRVLTPSARGGRRRAEPYLEWTRRQRTRAAPGTYMAYIEAVDSEGRVARATIPILLTR